MSLNRVYNVHCTLEICRLFSVHCLSSQQFEIVFEYFDVCDRELKKKKRPSTESINQLFAYNSLHQSNVQFAIVPFSRPQKPSAHTIKEETMQCKQSNHKNTSERNKKTQYKFSVNYMPALRSTRRMGRLVCSNHLNTRICACV